MFKKFRRLTASLVAASMLAGSVPPSAFAEEAVGYEEAAATEEAAAETAQAEDAGYVEDAAEEAAAAEQAAAEEAAAAEAAAAEQAAAEEAAAAEQAAQEAAEQEQGSDGEGYQEDEGYADEGYADDGYVDDAQGDDGYEEYEYEYSQGGAGGDAEYQEVGPGDVVLPEEEEPRERELVAQVGERLVAKATTPDFEPFEAGASFKVSSIRDYFADATDEDVAAYEKTLFEYALAEHAEERWPGHSLEAADVADAFTAFVPWIARVEDADGNPVDAELTIDWEYHDADLADDLYDGTTEIVAFEYDENFVPTEIDWREAAVSLDLENGIVSGRIRTDAKYVAAALVDPYFVPAPVEEAARAEAEAVEAAERAAAETYAETADGGGDQAEGAEGGEDLGEGIVVEPYDDEYEAPEGGEAQIEEAEATTPYDDEYEAPEDGEAATEEEATPYDDEYEAPEEGAESALEEETEDTLEETTEEAVAEEAEEAVEEATEEAIEEATESALEEETEEALEEESETEAASEEEAEVYDATKLPLVEVPASPDEALLADLELTEETMLAAAGDAPAPQDPVTADGMTIERIVIKWLSKSTGESEPAGYGRLSLAPQLDETSNMQWQFDFSLSGKHEHEAGSVEIVMPAYVWFDREGKEPGRLTLSMPEDPDTGSDFSWKRVGDSIVFTNVRPISAATKFMVQGTFRDITPHEMVDVDVSDGTGGNPASNYANAAYVGVSDPLYATINVTTPNGETISMKSNEIDASIDTYARAASATKTAYDPTNREYYVYWDVPSHMPAELRPDSPEDYMYVRWYVSGQAEGNQPFTMTIEDTPTDEYGMVLLGFEQTAEGVVKSLDGRTASALIFDGFNEYPKSAYVWTAYRKDAFPDEAFTLYTVHNSQTVTVTGWDDKISTTKTASAECSIAKPIEYRVVKVWDDNDDELGVRPSSQAIRIYRNPQGDNARELWQTVYLEEDPSPEKRAKGYGEWSYQWSDEGKAWHYETEEPWTGRGTFDDWYDDDGNVHRETWSYSLEQKTYDPDEREWVFVNTLHAGAGYEGDFSDMEKRVWAQYDDPQLTSTRDRALNVLMHGNDAIVPYDVWGIASTYDLYKENVLAGHLSSEEAIMNDAKRIDVTLEDYRDMINNQSTIIDDVELDSVDLNVPEVYVFTAAIRDETLPESDPNRYYDPPRYVLARMADKYVTSTYEAFVDGQWIEVGRLTRDGDDAVVTPSNGASVTYDGSTSFKARLHLPANTEKFRERASSYGVGCKVKYVMRVKVKPSEFVLDQIDINARLSDYLMMTVDNFAKLYLIYENGERSAWELQDWDRGYLHGRIYRVAAWAEKRFAITDNDPSAKRIKVHSTAKVTQQSNVFLHADYRRAAEEGDIPYTRAGVWFDLLPPGMEPDVSSVRLQDGDGIVDAYAVENYKGSGRTLLVVKATLGDHESFTPDVTTNPFYDDPSYPKEGYKQTQQIDFDAFYSWEDSVTYGLDGVRNVIAFESDDEDVGNLAGWSGEADDPTYGGNHLSEQQTRNDTALMTGLNPSRTDPSFVYAGADLITTEVDYAAETSIRKWVSAEGSGVWSYGHNNEAIVYEGGKYTYRINLTADPDTKTKDVIILDSIENYVPTSDKDDYQDAQWKGYFRSVNVDPIVEAGAAPVVWYSTVENLDITRETYNDDMDFGVIGDRLENDVDDGGNRVWSTTLPDDPSEVKAIAIDCRKAPDGSDFVLQEGQELHFYLYMRAPALDAAADIWGAGKNAPAEFDASNPDHNAHAYNNIYLDSTHVDGQNRETHAYIHWDYVKVGIVPFNLTVRKEWNDDDDRDGKRAGSVTVRLYKDGRETGDVATLDESNGWTQKFEHVLRYDYDTMRPDYDGLDDGHYISYTFSEDPVEEYEATFSRTADTVTVVNTRPPEKISVPFTKTWAGDEDDPSTRPAYVTMRLYANGEPTGKSKTVRPNEDGVWAGAFDDLFKYDHGQEIVYEVKEDLVDDYLASYEGTDVTNTYHPFGDLILSKELENATVAAGEVEHEFTVLLTTETNEPLVEKYAYRRYAAADPETTIEEGVVGHGDVIKLKGGERAEIKDIPSHSKYKVVEAKSKGFTNVSKTGDTGTILTGRPAEAAFVNDYSTKGSFEAAASKVLAGRDLTKNQFRFELRDFATNTLLRVVSCKADGSVSFGAIKFSNADDGTEKKYRIKEVSLGKPGYTYDYSSYVVVVKPRDNGDGTMTCDTAYYQSWVTPNETNKLKETTVWVFPDRSEISDETWNALSEPQKEEETLGRQKPDFDPETDDPTPPTRVTRAPAVFRNTYRATGSVDLKAWKQLSGRQLQDGEFQFQLLSQPEGDDQPCTVIQTKTCDADGAINWDPISFDEGDVGKTFHFFAREVHGDDETVVYDGSDFGYSVKVLDNGDGTLSFAQGHQTVEKEFLPGSAKHYQAFIYLYGDINAETYASGQFWRAQPSEYSYGMTESWPEWFASAYAQNTFQQSVTDLPEEEAYLRETMVDNTFGGDVVAAYGENGVLSFIDSAYFENYLNSGNAELMGDTWNYGDLGPSVDYEVTGLDTGDIESLYESSSSFDILDEEAPTGYEYGVAYVSTWTNAEYYMTEGQNFGMEDEIPSTVSGTAYRTIMVDYYVKADSRYVATGETDELPVFKNSLKEGSLSVTKLTKWAPGDEPDQSQTFHFKIRLVNSDGSPIEDQTMEYVPEQVTNIGETDDVGGGGTGGTGGP